MNEIKIARCKGCGMWVFDTLCSTCRTIASNQKREGSAMTTLTKGMASAIEVSRGGEIGAR